VNYGKQDGEAKNESGNRSILQAQKQSVEHDMTVTQYRPHKQ